MAGEKTEKATPKRRDEARKKGQVPRSADLNGAVVALVGLLALGALGPELVERLQAGMVATLTLTATPEVVERANVGRILLEQGRLVALAVIPVAIACVMAGSLTSVAQVGWKPSATALKPDPKRINPLQGAKQIFGKHALFEAAKNIVKVVAVGAIAALALFPELPELAALVGLPPAAFGAKLAGIVLGIAKRTAIAYLVIGAIDFAYQRYRHEQQLKMDLQEVKDEMKQMTLPAEVRSAQRRRQMEQARARMMSSVPEADVVVTNPTHYAVALRYDGSRAAPEVVAKGKDLLALKIRRIASEHGVPVVPDPPLARSLHEAVDVGGLIPEELFQAVAHVLAYVYRAAGRSAA